MNQYFSLQGRTAVVTGGTRGIGRMIAKGFLEAGARVYVCARDAEACAEAARELSAYGECHGMAANLASEEGVLAFAQQLNQEIDRLDILVNNAGTIRRNDALDFTEEDWDAVVGVNLKTLFFLSQAAGRHWVQGQRGGKIINIASMLSFQGGIRVASYTASKSGVLGVTRLLANEWAGRGINVNAIAPGYFATNNTEALRQDEGRNRAILERIPAGRWGDPSDLGGAAVFLSSAASDYVHGAVLPVDGGWLAR